MSQYNISYYFEHQLLPELFYKQTEPFVMSAIQKKDMLFGFMDRLFKDQGESNPYAAEDFTVEPIKIDEEVFALIVMFPQPIAEPLCVAALMLFDSDFTKKCYYCVEMGDSDGEGKVFLCAWEEDGRHVNYGSGPWDFGEVIERCRRLFRNRKS